MSIRFETSTLGLLLQLRLFRDLSAPELEKLMENAKLIDAPAGEYLIREGEPGHHLFVLLKGQARITKSMAGIQTMLQDLEPGECFGEMSLIDCFARSASVKAVTPCKLLKLDGKHVISLPDVSGKVYRNIAVLLSQKLRNANELLTLGR